ELKRVQALGYGGGVKVAQTNSTLQPNDILVGLHVWPTTSIKDVATILERGDLAELIPLKFYVVRQEMESDQEHPNGIMKDVVRSGRISVQLDGGSRGRRWNNDPSSAPPKSASSRSSTEQSDLGPTKSSVSDWTPRDSAATGRYSAAPSTSPTGA